LPPVGLTLNEYIRAQPGLTGTKRSCGEGGCGACTVTVLTTSDGIPKAVNSCFRPLCACDGWNITTIEGAQQNDLGAKMSATLSNKGGTQCGFCSPGMVMHLYTALTAAGKKGEKVTPEDIEKGMDGNICRCTGYRPILDTMKSFVTGDMPPMPSAEVAVEETTKVTTLSVKGKVGKDESSIAWEKPSTLDDAYRLLSKPGASVVCGYSGRCLPYSGSALGPSGPSASLYVDISGIKELQAIQNNADNIVVGAAVTFTSLIEALDTHSAASPGVFPALKEHLSIVACGQVRNVASIGGNLAIAAYNGDFPSDLMCILSAVGATVKIRKPDGSEVSGVRVELLRGDLSGGGIILSITIGFHPVSMHLYSFKVRKRRQNAHAIVNMACLLGLDASGSVLPGVRVVYGGIRPHVLLLPETAKALEVGGKLQDNNLLQKVFSTLATEATIDPSMGYNEYRTGLLPALLYKAILGALEPLGVLAKNVEAGSLPFSRPVTKATQTFGEETCESPLGMPVKKIEGLRQANGGCLYTNDMPAARAATTLHGAFVISTEAKAKIASVPVEMALGMPGVVRVIQSADLESAKFNNTIVPNEVKPELSELLLADGEVSQWID